METIFLVDDDAGVRKALSRMLHQEADWEVRSFDSAEAFLARPDPAAEGCLVLDVTLPGLDGLALQQQLARSDRVWPIVFLTGQGDIPMSVRAIKAGAADFLTKPVTAPALAGAVRAAFAECEDARRARAAKLAAEQRLAALTTREREVLAGVVQGRLNKQIASDLGIVEQTVKFHRARIMERMQVRTLAELMHVAARLGIS